MAKKSGKYAVSSNEDFEPGSHDGVLKNYLGITSKEEIEQVEAEKLKQAQSEAIDLYSKDYQFTSEDICDLHSLWLGDVYPSAGEYRSVDMSKGGFPFASATQIPRLMEQFEKDFLSEYTPCNFSDINELSFAIGVVHVELIIIHPFREGNGRISRLLANLMVSQADRPALDFSPIAQDRQTDGFNSYIAAIHAGVDGNYSLIQALFKRLIGQQRII